MALTCYYIYIFISYRCGHHFHKSCLTEWLTLNKKCPLCKQDFRGKEYEEDSEDEEEEERQTDNNFEEIPMAQINHTENNR